jgi:hypothetical protein
VASRSCSSASKVCLAAMASLARAAASSLISLSCLDRSLAASDIWTSRRVRTHRWLVSLPSPEQTQPSPKPKPEPKPKPTHTPLPPPPTTVHTPATDLFLCCRPLGGSLRCLGIRGCLYSSSLCSHCVGDGTLPRVLLSLPLLLGSQHSLLPGNQLHLRTVGYGSREWFGRGKPLHWLQ